METKKKIPKIRFKGFTEEWEENKLGDICSITTGKSNTQDKIYNGIYPFYVRSATIERSNKFLFDEEAVLTAGDGEVGKIYHYVNGKYDLHQRVYRMYNFKGIKGYFFYLYFMINFYNRVMIMTAKSSVDSVRLDMISYMNIDYPKIKVEQTRISDYFKKLDELIIKTEQKLVILKNIEKACLEKMFPKAGATIPEIRFKGFTDDWDVKILNDVSDVRDGTHDSPRYLTEGYKFITSKNIKNGEISFDEIQYISEKDFFEINKRSKVDINDILMGMIGTIGNIAIVKNIFDFAIKNVALIKYTEGVDYQYLYYSLQSVFILNQLNNVVDGGTQKFIALNSVRELVIPYPYKEEQTQIGNYFKKLDELIIKKEQKLLKLKNIKKACLEKMFV
ncbi:MAG: restriction endonuclease subunit S [Bacteroidetes bacterium]|nr:restriction endonuclease subunit S [Bacteroidota bacterium]